MPEPAVETGGIRSGRCARHPGAAAAASCDVCGRALCLSCIVPVRGSAVGRECLPVVLPDPPPPPAPAPREARGGTVALAGFALVVVLSALPWSRFGDASGPLQAWTPHWSLAAVAAGAVGLVLAVRLHRRPGRPTLEAGAQLLLALVVVGASLLHYDRPPPLSSPSIVPLLAAAAGAIAATGAILRGIGAARGRTSRTAAA